MKNLLIQQTIDQLTMTLEMLQSSHQEMVQSIPQNHPERQDLITSSENDLTKLQDLIDQWKSQIEPTQEFPNQDEAKALMFWCIKYIHLMVCNDNDQLDVVCDLLELGEGELFDAFETLSQTYGFGLEDE